MKGDIMNISSLLRTNAPTKRRVVLTRISCLIVFIAILESISDRLTDAFPSDQCPINWARLALSILIQLMELLVSSSSLLFRMVALFDVLLRIGGNIYGNVV